MLSPIDPHAGKVARAIAELRADPNLSAEESIRVLRWADPAAPTPRQHSQWLQDLLEWVGNLFGWLAQSGRVLMWVLAAILAAILALYIYRLVRRHDRGADRRGFVAPSHVRDLDIRPESLPDDVGATALALWRRGEQRASLALLYRGLLSRLVHVHLVPIRDSTTEGDSLALAARHADGKVLNYASNLIQVWQRAVYGAQVPEAEIVADLCTRFSEALDPPPVSHASEQLA